MQPKGIPDTTDEARHIVEQTASFDQHSPTPPHWPHSQIISLAHLCNSLLHRVDELERQLNEKPRRGRPPKNATTTTSVIADAEVDRVRAELAA